MLGLLSNLYYLHVSLNVRQDAGIVVYANRRLQFTFRVIRHATLNLLHGYFLNQTLPRIASPGLDDLSRLELHD